MQCCVHLYCCCVSLDAHLSLTMNTMLKFSTSAQPNDLATLVVDLATLVVDPATLVVDLATLVVDLATPVVDLATQYTLTRAILVFW